MNTYKQLTTLASLSLLIQAHSVQAIQMPDKKILIGAAVVGSTALIASGIYYINRNNKGLSDQTKKEIKQQQSICINNQCRQNEENLKQLKDIVNNHIFRCSTAAKTCTSLLTYKADNNHNPEDIKNALATIAGVFEEAQNQKLHQNSDKSSIDGRIVTGEDHSVVPLSGGDESLHSDKNSD
jgi:hypothetical protein